MDGRQRLLQSIDNLYMYLREKVLMNNNQVEIIVTPSRTKDKAPWLPHIMKRPSDNETIYDVQVYLNDRLYVRFSANMFDTKCKLRGIVSRIPQEYFEDKNVGDSIEFEDGRTGIVEDYDDEYLIVRDNNDNINKIKRFNDVPSLSSEYLGTMTNRADHSKHTFNLDNPEQLDKLKEIIIRYGLTANDFTEEDKKNHYFFYKILTNNLRSISKTGKAEVHYYYSDYLVDLDKLNEIIRNKIEEATNLILDAKFDINPKIIGDFSSCKYCPYRDICFKTNADVNELSKVKLTDFLGGDL